MLYCVNCFKKDRYQHCVKCTQVICKSHDSTRCAKCIGKADRREAASTALLKVIPDRAALLDFEKKMESLITYMETMHPDSSIFREPNERTTQDGIQYIVSKVGPVFGIDILDDSSGDNESEGSDDEDEGE